jgi:hypothetical protein
MSTCAQYRVRRPSNTICRFDLYPDGLVLYDQVGELEGTNEEDDGWLAEKKKVSADVQEIMLGKSLGLRNRKVELQEHIDQGDLPQFLGCRTEEEREAKRRKMASRIIVENPKQYIGKRVAKEFPIEDPNDPSRMMDSIFFGTVEYISDEGKLWYFVKYDDGDSEEYELKDIEYGLKLYDIHRDDDMKATQEPGANDKEEGKMDVDNDHEGEQKIEIDQDIGEPTKEPTTIPKNTATLINL